MNNYEFAQSQQVGVLINAARSALAQIKKAQHPSPTVAKAHMEEAAFELQAAIKAVETSQKTSKQGEAV